MARVIQTTLFTAILAYSLYTVEAHVRSLPTGFGCRNCNDKVAPGPGIHCKMLKATLQLSIICLLNLSCLPSIHNLCTKYALPTL